MLAAAGKPDTAAMDSQALAWFAGLCLGASLVVAVGAQNTFVLQQGLRREHVGAVVATCLGLDAILMTLEIGRAHV